MTTQAAYKTRLLARLKELDARLHSLEEALDAPDSKDWEEAAVENEGDEVLEALGHAGTEEVRGIRAALARMREGTYGECTKCGATIEPARLDTLPATPFCKSCAH